MGIEVLDFPRSFLVFEMDFDQRPPKTVTDARQNRHNRARIQIVCRCRIAEPDGKAIDYYLGGACKTERVGADRDTGIFSQPNADFQPVLSEEEALLLKSWERNDRGVMLVPPLVRAERRSTACSIEPGRKERGKMTRRRRAATMTKAAAFGPPPKPCTRSR